MLELSSFTNAKNTLNIKSALGFFASFSITDEIGFSNIPCGTRSFGLCSVGYAAFGYEIKIGPALTRQNIRYEKRRIDNEVSKLKEYLQDEEIDKIISIANSCKERANKDLDYKDVPFTILKMVPIQRIQKTDAGEIFKRFSDKVLGTDNQEEIHHFIEKSKNICIHQSTEEPQQGQELEGLPLISQCAYE